MSHRPTRRDFLQTLATASAVPAWLGTSSLTAADAESPRRKIKVGQIGTAHGHANKLAVYRQSPDYEVVGVVEPNAERRGRAAQQAAFRGLPWMTQDQLLEQDGLEVVLVETDVTESLDAAEAAIQAGKHIHLDKPAGASLPQFRRLLTTAEERQLVVQMGYMYRYNPGVVLLCEMLQQGWLGEIFEVDAVMSKVLPVTDRPALARFGGGMMFELGCHLIDLVVGLLGRPPEVSSFLQYHSPTGDGLADSTLAVLTYPRATATIRASGLEVGGGDRRHLTVCGTMGTFHIQPLDNPRVRVAFDRPRENYRAGYQEISLPKYARYVDDAAEMARILRGEAQQRFPYSHDLAVQETVLRASGMPL